MSWEAASAEEILDDIYECKRRVYDSWPVLPVWEEGMDASRQDVRPDPATHDASR